MIAGNAGGASSSLGDPPWIVSVSSSSSETYAPGGDVLIDGDLSWTGTASECVGSNCADIQLRIYDAIVRLLKKGSR